MPQVKRFSDYSSTLNTVNEESKLDNKDWKNIQTKVLKDLNINFVMTAKFGFGIGFFYPIVDSLVRNGITPVEITDDMIVMITVASFAIIFQEKKSEIKKLVEELRLRGIFGVMKNVFNVIKSIKDLLVLVFNACGKVVNEFSDLFNYTMIFVPCLISLTEVIHTKTLSLSTFLSCFATLVAGSVTITAKHLLTTYVQKLKDKLKDINIKSFLDFFKIKEEKVKKFSDYKEEDLINDAEVDLKILDEK